MVCRVVSAGLGLPRVVPVVVTVYYLDDDDDDHGDVVLTTVNVLLSGLSFQLLAVVR